MSNNVETWEPTLRAIREAVRGRWRATSVLVTAITQAESMENERLLSQAMVAVGMETGAPEMAETGAPPTPTPPPPQAQLHLSDRVATKPNPDARELDYKYTDEVGSELGRFFRHSAFFFRLRVGLADS